MTGAAGTWLGARPVWQRLILAFVAGALATLAFAPWYALPILFISFPVLGLLTQASRSKGAAFLVGWAFGLGHFATGFYWVGNALEIAGAPREVWLGLPIGLAIYPGIGMLVFWWLHNRTAASISNIILFAAIWSLSEWLRGHLFTGFPWNLTGYVWGFSDAMSQFASVGGAYGLTFFTVLAATLPALIVGQSFRSLPFWRPLAGSAALLFGLLVFGVLRLPSDLASANDGPIVRVVQANIAQKDKWRPDLLDDHFIKYLTMSEQKGAEDIDLFLWPEAAIPYRLDRDAARTVMIGRIAQPGSVVLTGYPRLTMDEHGGYTFQNSMIAIDHTGANIDLFDKFHLVPFGEYVPLRWLFTTFGVEKLVEEAGDFVPGPGPRVITLPGLPSVSPLICYEVIFPGAVTPLDARPDWLFNLTNDAWYGERSGPFQHLVIARFRSIEEGLPMVRAAGTGISAIIDSYGRVVNQLGLGKRGILDGRLPPPLPEPTLYARFGDSLFWLLLGLSALIVLLSPKLSAGSRPE